MIIDFFVEKALYECSCNTVLEKLRIMSIVHIYAYDEETGV